MADGAFEHSSGAHPHSAQRGFIARARLGLRSLTPLLGFENDDHQDDEHYNEKPSPYVDEGHPEEGDNTQANDSKYVLRGDGQRAVQARGSDFRVFKPRISKYLTG